MPGFEELVTNHTNAMNNLAAALLKSSGVPAGATTTAAEPKRPPGRPKRVTLNDVKGIAEKVRDTKGRDTAVRLIEQHGAKTLAELEEGKYAAFVAACEVALQEQDEDTGHEADL